MNENTPFSELLKDYRKRNRYTQEDTAKYLGYSKETITAWECGRRYPALEDFSRLACLMDIDSQDLAQSINKSRVKTRNIALHSLMKNTDENEQLDNAESIINLAWEAWFASKPKQAAREVYKLLPQLDRIHHSNSSSSHSLRIRELVIRCHGLLGAIRLDALENDTALFHYMQAHRLAAEGHDLNQATTYLALIGDTFRRQGEKGKAISYMENAKELAIGTTRATQGHILQLLAYSAKKSSEILHSPISLSFLFASPG